MRPTVNSKAETLKMRSHPTDANILGSPSRADGPWPEFPYPAFWVDRFPSDSSANPQFMAVVYDEERRMLWLDADDELDVALPKARAASRSEGGKSAVVYRYLIHRGSPDPDAATKCSVLIDGYYELSTLGIAAWVSAAEVTAPNTPTD
ncbi:hypothetical protein [Brachybacterium paraconglomeratum]|uniref:hypothetical protein n=1 Tax=Brachybacterium paraconglomeratum TaxID=173362 RepID=UPI0022E3647C|nr:hypothetical protein [Brachybacterium paraconglomeratum]